MVGKAVGLADGPTLGPAVGHAMGTQVGSEVGIAICGADGIDKGHSTGVRWRFEKWLVTEIFEALHYLVIVPV